jgi:hypothetical protein
MQGKVRAPAIPFVSHVTLCIFYTPFFTQRNSTCVALSNAHDGRSISPKNQTNQNELRFEPPMIHLWLSKTRAF